MSIWFDTADIDPFSDIRCQSYSDRAIGVNSINDIWTLSPRIHFVRLIDKLQHLILWLIVMRNAPSILTNKVLIDESFASFTENFKVGHDWYVQEHVSTEGYCSWG